MKKPIMHPTDFSPASRAAFAQALAMARDERTEVLLVHVVSTMTPFAAEEYVSPTTYADLQQAVRADAGKQLDKLVAKAKAARVPARALVVDGSPAEAIVRTARAKRAKIIVVGTHGRTGLARLLMGSVAERVVGTAPCPVLTVRGK